MRQRFLSTVLLLFIAVGLLAEGRAKYVFFFIGDGMGLNQVHLASTYLAAQEGRIGTAPMCITSFPYTGFINTSSATNGVTDSAAGGTALSTGQKTRNGVIGMLPDGTTAINSVAVWAKEAGAAVGVGTSVSVDHATPASFYAHASNRNMYHLIGKQLIEANFDFYAGSDFLKPTSEEKGDNPKSLYEQCQEGGYYIARGAEDYNKNCRNYRKLILLQTEEASKKDRSAIPYAINKTEADLTLQDITRSGIDFLTRKKKDGFFMMIEGGKIDWACHANDAATVLHETLNLDSAIRIAYDFYKKRPKETLIVVTADHETGGLALGRGPYELHADLLQYQRMSADAYSNHLAQLCQEKGERLSWADLKEDLKKHWGFWEKVTLKDKQTGRLKKAAAELLTQNQATEVKSMYASVNTLADVARQILAECALVGWQSGGHSNAAVPVWAIGAGSELFTGYMENTEVPKRIAKAAGWKVK